MATEDFMDVISATGEMIDWLMHPAELGKKPSKIECTNQFETEDGISCFVFKFKKSVFGKWLLGIVSESGTFSEFEEYREETNEQDARKLLGILQDYWKKQAENLEEGEEQEHRKGAFLAFVLLGEKTWDREKYKRDFETDWGIAVKDTDEAGNPQENADAMVFDVDNMRVVIGYMDAPVPNGEAEKNAAMNYMWKDAEKETKKHKAHIIVAVMGDEEDLEKKAKLYVKAVTSMCKQNNVIGINTNGIVYEPGFYLEMAGLMKEDSMPLFNLVWFGLVRSEHGFHAYTIGLDSFGKDEIEILDAEEDPETLRGFLMDIVGYVMDNDVTLHAGETIGLTEDQKLPITRSQGVCIDGVTLKIQYNV